MTIEVEGGRERFNEASVYATKKVAKLTQLVLSGASFERIVIKMAKVSGKGDVIVKKTKRGRTFFGCSRYPECDFASWTKPTLKKVN